MANKIDQFWEIFKAVAGETSTVTDSINAIAKSDRTKVESYFSNVIDQYTFETKDYNRLRKFMINLYASFRTQSTISLSSSDPHSLTNSDLDELFRSMGYNLSTSLKGVDENPLEQKVQFFLDLVNLYKVKGTPQSLVDVLQYYGVTEVDIYEFFLKKDAPDSLFFDGKAVAGTTDSPNTVGIPYNNLTATDPHWLYTAQQILQLDQINKINLPSKSPYLGIQPTVNLEGAEISIIQRLVQDQYDSYISTGVLPTANAEITYTGEVVSFLELYLACIYMFNQLYEIGAGVSKITFVEYEQFYSQQIEAGESEATVSLNEDLNTDYSIGISIRFDPTADILENPVQFSTLITNKTVNSFNVLLSGVTPSENYYIDWFVLDSTCADIVNIDATCTSQIITLPCTCSNYSVSGAISNYVDSIPSVYSYTISDKTPTSFKINFSGPIDSENYQFEYFICVGENNGNISIAPGSSVVDYSFPVPVANNVYPLFTTLESDGDVYAWTVIEKTKSGFTVELSDPVPMDSTNFNLSWAIPTIPPSILVTSKNFICYDGTNTSEVDIINEFDLLTNQVVLTRGELRTRYDQYIDTFSRPVSMNFLIDKSTAGTILNVINPAFKSSLDNAGDQEDVMYSLLKDLALWVRANVGFGFVSFGFILFGLQEFFNDLKPVIDFFKPYRARLILLESLQVKNRLFNTIVMEDEMSVSSNVTFHDYVTGDSNPCCNIDDSTCANVISVYKREFVDGVTSYNWRSLWATETEYVVDDAVASGVGFHWICIQVHTSGYETKPGTGTDWTLYWDLLSEVVCTEEQPTRIKCTSDGTSTVCIDTPAPVSYYSRETYDCNSYFDIGAVTDLRRHVPHINVNPLEPHQVEYSNDPTENNVQTTIEDTLYDHLRCPAGSDATGGAVVSEITSVEYLSPYSEQIEEGVDSVDISLNGDYGTSYSIGLSVRFDPTADILENPVQFTTLITEKTVNSFTVSLSGVTPSENYYIDWYILDSTCSDIVNIDATCTSQIITLPCTCSNYSISGVITNYTEPLASVYGYTITDKTSNQFTINFSGPIESENYQFEYFICMGVDNGNIAVAPNSSTVSYSFPVPVANNVYPLLTMLESDNDIYAWTVTEKTETGFTVELSDPAPADSTNFNMSWSIPTVPPSVVDDITYYQSSGFRDFDGEGTFDCTHGFDLVQITIEKILGYMLQENGFFILQEDGNRILL